MWGFDPIARVSEYTVLEPRAEDHCVRLDDLTFYSTTPDGTVGSVGSVLAISLVGASDDSPLIRSSSRQLRTYSASYLPLGQHLL